MSTTENMDVLDKLRLIKRTHIGNTTEPYEDGWVMIKQLQGRPSGIVSKKITLSPNDPFARFGKTYKEILEREYGAKIVSYRPHPDELSLMENLYIAVFPAKEQAEAALEYFESIQLATHMEMNS